MPTPTRTVSVSIARPMAEVYAFVIDPENIPRWAPAFARSVHRVGDEWIVDTADGPVRVAFAPRNPFGVADHVVTAETGAATFNPMRVITNGDGAEVLFTLIQAAGTDDGAFAADAALVESDLQALKRVLEDGGA